MVHIKFYLPDESTSLANSALAKRLDSHFESWPASAVSASLGEKRTPCVLACITDTESVAWQA